MISIIVCHRNPIFLEHFQSSVAQTVGVDYEIVVIDNSKGSYGICEAYNMGGYKAKYEILCFVHEDVLFHTQNWGTELKKLFELSNVGAVGVAGARFFGTKWASYWNADGRGSTRLIQHFKDGKVKLVDYSIPSEDGITEVKSLDGVFIACPKWVWEETKFDQDTFRGFHCYDMDFTLRIASNHRVLTAKTITIEHFSEGNYDKRFFEQKEIFDQKWGKQLPIHPEGFSRNLIISLEWKLFWNYCYLKRKVFGYFVIKPGEILNFHLMYPNFIYLLATFVPWPLILFNKARRAARQLLKRNTSV